MTEAAGSGSPEVRTRGGERAFRPRPFRPARWLPGPHAQTLGGKLMRSHEPPPRERLRLEMPDGDFVDVDLSPDPAPDAPLVLVLHGLEGSARRGYVVSLCHALLRADLRPAALNFRGCSGEANRRARSYHSGETGDLALVVEELRERHPDRPLGLVGFSLGGNVLLKYLGERGDGLDPAVKGAVAISVPFDLAAGSRIIEEGLWGRLYTHYFLRMLKERVRARRRVLEKHVDVRAALEAPTLWAFDDAVTAPLHGFRDARDYYRKSSSLGFLERIRVPTLLLQARDDPFQPAERLPEGEVRENPSLVAAFPERGGHVGFVSGPPWAPRFWAERESVRFLATFLRE